MDFVRVERRRRNRGSVLVSANLVVWARPRFEFSYYFVVQPAPIDAVEVCVVIGASAWDVDPRECADALRRELRDNTAHPVGADRQRCVKLVRAQRTLAACSRVLSANPDNRAFVDQKISEPEALATIDGLKTSRRVDHRGVHQHAPKAESASVDVGVHEFAAVVEVRTNRAHPRKAHATQLLEGLEHAHSVEDPGPAAEHDMRREPIRRETILVDEQHATAVAGEEDSGGAAGYARADDYRVKGFR